MKSWAACETALHGKITPHPPRLSNHARPQMLYLARTLKKKGVNKGQYLPKYVHGIVRCRKGYWTKTFEGRDLFHTNVLFCPFCSDWVRAFCAVTRDGEKATWNTLPRAYLQHRSVRHSQHSRAEVREELERHLKTKHETLWNQRRCLRHKGWDGRPIIFVFIFSVNLGFSSVCAIFLNIIILFIYFTLFFFNPSLNSSSAN